MKAVIALLAIIVLIALVFGSMYVGRKNQMVTLDEQVKSNWAQVDVVLQRRADLIPNLVETVKGFAAHEEKVFGDIAAARSALIGAKTPADKIAANGQLDGALSRLLVITENYPQLKATQAFRDLSAQLEGAENRITVARGRYIKTVEAYNVSVRSFPNNLTAMMFGYKPKPNFTVANEKEISVAPKVDFGKPAPAPVPAPSK